MGVTREQVYNALQDRLIAALLVRGGPVPGKFQTITRRWRSVWDDPNQRVADLPLLVQWEGGEAVSWSDNRGIGPIWTLRATLEFYAKIPDGQTPGVPDGATPGSATLNPILDALQAIFVPGMGDEGRITLGDLVYDCRIEGDITKVLGDEDPSGQCGALVPINILVPYWS